ncbi:hypothetical protein DMS87_04525 [Klebsiella variicola]|jgi:hypothetical protein|uniref:hypothetical protein n=1 Tax=Klebsiella TaxID=570 RepID=UPI000C799F67|nr:hypothetical protein [Klebsiella variicola]MBR8850551.1 hypothetical protein [Klebsiella variicola]MBW5964608.1 hypothetical protein [Klebsiella variicola]MCD9684337.1 hypothetical protein [Klebsiella variicola subsp. variicola]MCD9836157.1 hypothetical protein [Klebsiella variicola subsp. variicola]MCW9239185.1 hypothetical protein [Klebsiella variicola]
MKKLALALALCASFSAHAFTTGFTCDTQGLTAGDNDTRASMSMSYGQAAWTIAGFEFTGAYGSDTGTVLTDGKGNQLITNGSTEVNSDGSYTSYIIIKLKNGKQYGVDCGADNNAGEAVPPTLDLREYEVVSTPDTSKVSQDQQKAKVSDQSNKPLTPADDASLVPANDTPNDLVDAGKVGQTTNWDNQAAPTPLPSDLPPIDSLPDHLPSHGEQEPSNTHILLLVGVLLACAVLAKTEYKHYQLKKKMKADADKYFNLFK